MYVMYIHTECIAFILNKLFTFEKIYSTSKQAIALFFIQGVIAALKVSFASKLRMRLWFVYLNTPLHKI